MLKHKSILVTLFTLMVMLLLVGCGSLDTTTEDGSDADTTNDSGNAVEEQSHEFVISHLVPTSHVLHKNIAESYVSDLEEASNGRITGEIYPSNTLGENQYDMAATGTADIAFSVHGYTAGRFPLVSVVELPFIADSAENGADILWTLYQEFPELQDEHGDTTPLWLFAAEPAQILSADIPIKSVEDLNGLRVRSPSPLANQILESFGATPVSMPMGEVYEALQRGVVDAAMAPISTVSDFSFSDVVSYITVGNFSLTPFFAVMNTDTYNSLSESDQELISTIGSDYAKKAGAAFDASGANGRKIALETEITMIELEDLSPWEAAVDDLVENWIKDMEDKGFPGREMYERAVELGNN
ncbi:TRAP transporter substrate-binding protein [Bacillus sp. FJAT-45350]|uniref:TRAP transporter substrate-binding protein n=1 Tax=Bacillus sp. FJAT-45350 TaxID=2011014 RepID=UPI000BB81E13|nr:TRAP transporter substrate-binding protein [Bacillus sp. FJAT-45350]